MEQKPRTGTIAAATIGIILFAIYALAIYFFAGELNACAWVSILFTAIAFVLTFAMPRVIGDRPDVQAVFFGIPLFGLTTFYFLAQIFLGAVFIFFQNYISLEVAFFVQVVLLALFVIVFIVSYSAQKTSAQKSDERRVQAVTRDIHVIDAKSLLDEYRTVGQNPDVIKALEHLSEAIRYSDPISNGHPAIAEIDARIAAQTDNLRMACAAGDDAAILQQTQLLENLYAQRSRTLLVVK